MQEFEVVAVLLTLSARVLSHMLTLSGCVFSHMLTGLDPSSYRSASSRQDDGCEEGMVGSGEGQPSDAKLLFVHCPHCQHRVEVRGSKVREVIQAIVLWCVSHCT